MGVSQNEGVPFGRVPIITTTLFWVYIGAPPFRETTKLSYYICVHNRLWCLLIVVTLFKFLNSNPVELRVCCL